MPMPVSDSNTLASDALLVNVTPPLRATAEAGPYVTVKVIDCPDDSVVPLETPLAVKPAPATVAFENVTVEGPELETVNFCVTLLPTFTLPKLKLAGLTVRYPGEGGV